MDAKTFLKTVGIIPDEINFETGEGYITISPDHPLMFGSIQFPRQFIKMLPYEGGKLENITEVIQGIEVEFCRAPNYLVVEAPGNPRGFPFLRICGDLAFWSMTNSAPF